LKKIIAFTLFLLIIAFTIIHDRNNYLIRNLDVPTIEEIASIKLSPASVGAISGNNTVIFNLNDPNQKIVIAEILYWLKHSTYIGIAKDQFISFGSSPTTLVITTKNGARIAISDAIGTISTTFNGSGIAKSASIRDQVTIYTKNIAVRVQAPELKEWIEQDWQDLQSNKN
jgi:hypothetical protein